jgi:ubiquinone/menaquinone biosynthesis C-methylase UbiE
MWRRPPGAQDGFVNQLHSVTLDYDGLAEQYAQHRQVHPGVLANLATTGQLDRGSQVLEVGCGTGNYVVALEALTGCSGWGLDPSAQMLCRARQRGRAIRFTQGKAEQLAHAAKSFDLVFSVDVIHHVGNLGRYFAAAHRVLRDRGRLCTVTDSEDIIRQRRPLSVYFPETVEVELQRYPRVAALRALLGQAGFVDLQEVVVECAYAVHDIRAYRDKAYSSLHLISPEALERGIRRMEWALEVGPIQGVARYCLLWGRKAAAVDFRSPPGNSLCRS